MSEYIKSKNPVKYEIRKASIDDIDEIVDVYNDVIDYVTTLPFVCRWKRGVYPTYESASKAISEQSLFVLSISGKIVASVILNNEYTKTYDKADWGIDVDYDDIIVVHTVAVHPNYLKLGLGKAITMYSIEYARSLNKKAIRLDAAKENIPANALYISCGFVHVATVDLEFGVEGFKWSELYQIVF